MVTAFAILAMFNHPGITNYNLTVYESKEMSKLMRRYEPQSYWWTDGLLALFVLHRSGETISSHSVL